MADLPADHGSRAARARRCLEWLSIGDAFGERFFAAGSTALIRSRTLPPDPWRYTDDTEMALGLFDCLDRHGRVDQDALARIFAERYHHDPWKGYGGTVRGVLRAIKDGVAWRTAASLAWGGEGSRGNGSAMRVGVVGAWFADDPDAVVREAAASAGVTHAHPDAVAGAIAIAMAVALAWREPGLARDAWFAAILAVTPSGPTRDGIARARTLPPGYTVDTAVAALGNGSGVVCADTVPLCLWLADRHAEDYAEALWSAVGAGGDRDTIAAITGAILGCRAGTTLPSEWPALREPLQFDEDLRPCPPGVSTTL